MKQSLFPYIKTLLFLVLMISSVKADWINYTGAESASNIAEIYISDDNVTVKLEVSFKDIATFKELVPETWTKDKGVKRPSLEKRLDYFSNHTLKMIADGKVLPAKLVVSEGRSRIERKSKNVGKLNPYTNKIIKGSPDDKHVLYTEIVYKLSNKPKNLVIVPPFDQDGDIKATIGFVTYHNAVPLNDFRYLSKSSKLDLDWVDPWFTKFQNKNLQRHHKYPLMVYLYIEPRLVRVESLMRVDDISKLTSFEQVDEKNRKLSLFKEHLRTYFKDDTKLHINKSSVLPDLVEISYFKVGLSGLELLDDIQEKDLSSLLVGVSQKYYVDRLPESIDSPWLYFNDKIDSIPFVSTDPKGPYYEFIYKDEPAFKWVNYIQDKTEPKIIPVGTKTGTHWKLPIFGEVKVWNELPTQEQSAQIIKETLENIRTAFIEKREERLSKELSKVFLSENNQVIQKELSKLFTPSVVRGGVGAIEEFGTLSIDEIRELKDADGFSASVSGDVKVIAKHWGHSDRRALKYQCIIDMIEKDGQWFIKDFSLLDLKDKTS